MKDVSDIKLLLILIFAAVATLFFYVVLTTPSETWLRYRSVIELVPIFSAVVFGILYWHFMK